LTYHHYRRLSEHWPETSSQLRPAAKLVALTIANHLNKDSGRWAMSAKTISEWAGGLSRGSIDTAVKKLEALGLFEVSRDSQRKPRDFRLLVECPQGCERLKEHNTPSELQLALARPKAELTELPNLKTTPNELPNLRATELPNLERELPNLLATNKELIESNKKDDKQDSFEFLFITETLKELNETNQFQSGHALLKAALDSDRDLVLERAKEVMAKGTVPKKYLKASIINHPESLIKRPPQDKTPDPTKPKQAFFGLVFKSGVSTGQLEHYWRALQTHTNLCEWTELSRPQIDFLGHLSTEATPLKNTAANLVSDSVRAGLRFAEYPNEPEAINPKTLSELAEHLNKHNQKQPTNAAINQETF
jgi:DNA-binding MarR family transcriptional regulator